MDGSRKEAYEKKDKDRERERERERVTRSYKEDKYSRRPYDPFKESTCKGARPQSFGVGSVFKPRSNW